MKVLLVFATNSGGTQLASQIVQEVLEKHSHEVEVKEVRDTKPEDFASHDLIILTSPSWDFEGLEGQPHPDYRPFMEQFTDNDYSAKKFAVFGLGDSSYTYFCGAVKHLEDFVKKIKGNLISESLKIDGFYMDQEKSSELLNSWTENLSQKLS